MPACNEMQTTGQGLKLLPETFAQKVSLKTSKHPSGLNNSVCKCFGQPVQNSYIAPNKVCFCFVFFFSQKVLIIFFFYFSIKT